MHLYNKFASDSSPTIDGALYWAQSGADGGRTNPARMVADYSDYHYMIKLDGGSLYSISSSQTATDLGTADIAAALSTVVTAANFPNGGKVLIAHDGELNSTSASAISSVNNIHIVGTPNLTIKPTGFTSGTVWDAIKLQSCNDVIIEGFTIDGNRASYTFGDPLTNLGTDDVGNGLHFDTCSRYTIRDMRLKNGLFHGFFGSGQSGSGNIFHTKMFDNGYRGAHIHGAAGFSIDGFCGMFNEIYNNAQQAAAAAALNGGFFLILENATDVIIANNYIHDEGGSSAIELSGTTGGGPAAKSVTCTGNIIESCDYGIRALISLQDFNISSNTIRNTTNWGIEINTGINGTVSSNVITDGADWGIYLNNAAQKHISLCNNVIARNVGGGIRARGSYISIGNNQFIDNTVNGGGFKDQLFMTTLTKSSVYGNQFTDDTWANTGRAMYLDANCKDVHMTDNLCGNTGAHDIRCASGATGIFSHNNRCATITDDGTGMTVINDVGPAFT